MTVSLCPVLGRCASHRSSTRPVHAVSKRSITLLLFACLVPATWVTAQVNVGPEWRVDSDPLGTSSSSLPQMVDTNDGTLHMVWQDYRDPQWVVYYRRAPNFGSSMPTPEVPLSILMPAPMIPPNAADPVIATDGALAIYVAWHWVLEDHEGLGFSRSTDGGLSWSPASLLVDSVTGMGVASEYASPPHLAADNGGRVYITWTQSNGIRDQVYYAVSSDYGATFSVPPITQPVNIELIGHSESARVATDGRSHVYVAWLDNRDPPYRDVWVRHSTDWGQTWEPGEQRLSAHGVEIQLNLVAHATQLDNQTQHRVLAAWVELEEDDNGLPITYVNSRYSKDGATTFQTHEGAIDNRHPTVMGSGNKVGAGAGSAPPVGSGVSQPGSGGPSATGGGNTLGTRSTLPGFDKSGSVAIFLDVTVDAAGNAHAVHGRVDSPFVGQPTSVYYNRLDGNSGVWTVEHKLSRGGSPYPEKGYPTFARPSIAAAGSSVYVAWMSADPGYGERTEILGTFSTDGGQTFQKAARLSADPSGPGLARSAYPRVVARPGRGAVVWDDRRSWTLPTVLPLPPGVPVGAPDVYLTTFGP